MKRLWRDFAGPALLLIGASALAQQVTLNIESQPMPKALASLAAQTGMQVIFPSREVAKDLQAPAVNGRYTPQAAVKMLLVNSGLQEEWINERTVAIRIAPAKSSAADVGEAGERAGEGLALARAEQASTMQRVASAEEQKIQADTSSRPEGETKQQAIAEIVVTAQKRKESLQEVPISISVVSGADLDKSRAQGITETLSRIPAVAVSEGLQGGGTQITIRGVSTGAALISGASTSAYYIDSVPFGFVRHAVAPDPNAYDLERLEVLRGPQGTLYGANALNGVVRILTHDADLDSFEFKARTSMSTTDDGGQNYRGDMAVNVPIIQEKLAVRAVLGYNDQSGWVDAHYPDPIPQYYVNQGIDPNLAGSLFKAGINDTQLANARIKLKARPTENLTIGLSAWASRNDYGAPPISKDDQTVSTNFNQPMETDFTAYGLDVGYDFGAFSISSATSYIDYSNGGDLADLLFTGIDSRVLAQEVLLSSTDKGAWQWSLGAFYRDAEDEWFQDLYGAFEGFPGSNFIDTSESYALFGELSRRFFHDQLKWTLGLRYFHDEGATESFELDPGSLYSDTYEATTPRAVLIWTPSADLSIYGSYSQGFRSGAYQHEFITRFAPFYPPVEPDTLSNYEIGVKGNFLGQRVSFEAAVFYIDWRDVQQMLNIQVGELPNGDPIGINVAINGESASGLGADLALTARPIQTLELGASFSWNDLTTDEAVFSLGGQNVPVQAFAAGDRLAFSPEYTASVFADYAFPIRSGFEGRLSGSINYTSPQDGMGQDVLGNPKRYLGDDITIARASFSLEAADHWTAMLYIDNLNNEDDAVLAQFDSDTRVRPRTVGLQFEYQW